MITELTPEELVHLKGVLEQIGSHLPTNHAPYVWDMFNRLNGTNTPRPCTCGSAGRYWKEAVDFLFNYVKGK